MARVAKKPATGTARNKNGAAAPAEPENISGYFRKLFRENPKLLKTRSNDEVLSRWLVDHPDEKEVPARVKQGLANVKSVMRSKKRTRKASKMAAVELPSATTVLAPRKAIKKAPLETLEERIDECMILAREQGVEELASIIALLRRARNEVVWKIGQ